MAAIEIHPSYTRWWLYCVLCWCVDDSFNYYKCKSTFVLLPPLSSPSFLVHFLISDRPPYSAKPLVIVAFLGWQILVFGLTPAGGRNLLRERGVRMEYISDAEWMWMTDGWEGRGYSFVFVSQESMMWIDISMDLGVVCLFERVTMRKAGYTRSTFPLDTKWKNKQWL